ncbi:uncharacterized protein LOC101451930 [Ceratitis capitata]|uniref:uncharacterized protein LOC101451930 n=1 Tax=Ceratitis capitata TaxID=7213 RepID=UPI00032999EF|nr:uncharacterized protein LOC101451930 [Ceratitis capitata]
MFKLLILLSFFAMAFARPGYLHSAPILTTYREEQLTALPAAVHIVEPLVTTQQIVTPLLHGSILSHGLP